ncbi:MAG: hypothetical protein A3H13_02400 [Candidatus Taylorbacteria bacterium RIFCSPLOWO2_12_FULL_48_11]|nr:MAG: hypothetical protein A3H13_02400 [Candidatus Taylorbacteria bacterium RIFCSPLOWO2_12_FULL_48_11]
MSSFQIQRDIFRAWSSAVSADAELKTHLENAIRRVLTEYDTAVFENRFIVGGVIEYIVLAAINGSDVVKGKHVGGTKKGVDVCIDTFRGKPCAAEISIKYSSSGDIRMINTLGVSTDAHWNEATLFVLPEIGIVYADAAQIPKSAIVRMKDAISVSRKAILKHAQKNKEFVLQVTIPAKTEIAKQKNPKTAIEDIARAIIRQFARLKL